MSDSPPEESASAVEEDGDDGGELWFDEDVDNSELAQKERIRGLSPVPTEHGRKVAFNALPVEVSQGAGGYKNYWTDPDPPKEAEAYIQEGPQREPPKPENAWRVVEYYCASCHRRCLVDHAEKGAKYHECRDCARVPAIDQKVRDHRLTSLLWAHLAARDSTARSGEDGQVLGGRAVPTRDRPDRPAGSEGLTPCLGRRTERRPRR